MIGINLAIIIFALILGKNIYSSQIGQIQSSLRRATLLGKYEMFDGNPDYINTEIAAYLAVTADQIQAAAKKYCTPERRFVLEIAPAPKPEK